jgi:hypothetical protein
MVIENGESGGGTTAPKVNAVLKAIFGEVEKLESRVGVGERNNSTLELQLETRTLQGTGNAG